MKDLTKQLRPEYRIEEVTWRERISKSLRDFVFDRDGYVCQYCTAYCYDSWVNDPHCLNVDHIFPVHAGGRSKAENLITACRDCNQIKHDKIFQTFEEAREYILARKHGELHTPLSLRQEAWGPDSDGLPLDS